MNYVYGVKYRRHDIERVLHCGSLEEARQIAKRLYESDTTYHFLAIVRQSADWEVQEVLKNKESGT